MLGLKVSELLHVIQTEPMYMFFCASMLVVAVCGLAILAYEVITWFGGGE